MLLLNYDDNWEQSEQTAEEATHSTSTVDSTKLLRPENQFSKKSQRHKVHVLLCGYTTFVLSTTALTIIIDKITMIPMM